MKFLVLVLVLALVIVSGCSETKDVQNDIVDSSLESNQVHMENETIPPNVSIEMKINTEVIIP